MGCGKSSVGRRLSELLCCSFIDLDDVIEEREGRSIPEIFATEGEATFRGFYGQYDVEIEVNGAITRTNINLGKNEANEFRIIIDE